MREPLYRFALSASMLLPQAPPLLCNSHKMHLLQLAYPSGFASAGTIYISRWLAETPVTLDLTTIPVDIRPDYYDYEPTDVSDALEWHVNFADRHNSLM